MTDTEANWRTVAFWAIGAAIAIAIAGEIALRMNPPVPNMFALAPYWLMPRVVYPLLFGIFIGWVAYASYSYDGRKCIWRVVGVLLTCVGISMAYYIFTSTWDQPYGWILIGILCLPAAVFVYAGFSVYSTASLIASAKIRNWFA